jgi:hypothetical protein
MKSKGVAAWLAVLGGGLGLHRFYLGGLGDRWGHLQWPLTLLALVGLRQVEQLGVDAPNLTWALPLLSAMIAAACLQGIVIALTNDERWQERWQQADSSGWPTVLAAVFGLLLGGASLMLTVAFSAQRYFELTS